MDIELVVLRLVHVVLGAFWAGGMLFLVIFVVPSIGAQWPHGAWVLRGINQRRFPQVIPIIALLTIVTGLRLYWRASGGLSASWFQTGTGLSFTVGGLAALGALVEGIVVVRPRATRMDNLLEAAATAPAGPDRDAKLTQARESFVALRGPLRATAVMLAVALVSMAVARYV